MDAARAAHRAIIEAARALGLAALVFAGVTDLRAQLVPLLGAR